MPEQKIPPTAQPPSEKREFLRREEIKTMQKEINRIREEGVQKEREQPAFAESFHPRQESGGQVGEAKKNMEDAKRIRDFLEQAQKRAAPEGGEPRPDVSGREEKIAQNLAEIKQPEMNFEDQIEKGLQALASKMQSLKAKKNQITAEAEKLKFGLTAIYEKERIIEIKKKSIEEKEAKAAGTEEKKNIEQERWATEKQRQDIEKERWSVEEDIESCQNELKRIDADWQQLLSKKKEIERQKEEIAKKESKLKLKEEKIQLEKELEALEAGWSSREAEKNNKLAQKNKISGDLRQILENEKTTEETIKQLEQKESLAVNQQDKRQIEQERQLMEAKRVELEKSRWNLETENNNVGLELKKAEDSHGNLTGRRNAVKNRLKEIAFQTGPAAIESEPAQPKIESADRHNLPQKPTQTWTRPDTGFGERIEMTINKEEAARKDFLEKIQEPENKKAAPLQETTAKNYQQNQETATSLHRRQSFLEKTWIRFTLVVLTLTIFFFVAAFWYWYLKINK